MKPVLRKGVYMYISLGRFIYLNYFTFFYIFLNLLLCVCEHVYAMALVWGKTAFSPLSTVLRQRPSNLCSWAEHTRLAGPWASTWLLSISWPTAEGLGLQVHGTDKPATFTMFMCVCACLHMCVCMCVCSWVSRGQPQAHSQVGVNGTEDNSARVFRGEGGHLGTLSCCCHYILEL